MVEREKLISMVRGLQNGEEHAAAELFETFQKDIYYFILKTVNNDRDLAEDLTQDTFVNILEKIGDLEEPAAFVTWSKQIAYHKCTDYFKKRKELLVDEDEEGYSVFDTVEEENEEFLPDAALDKEDLKNTIIEIIGDLPEDQRSAIILRYFNEISVKEIAQIQNVSEGTVKSRLNYGRKAIKQSVEEYEKKNNVKLHCVGIIPLLLWLFKCYRQDADLSMSSGTSAQTFVTGKDAAGAAAAGSSSALTGKTAAVMGVKGLGKALVTKIVAGILAVIVIIVSIVVGISHIQKQKDTPPAMQETNGLSGETHSATEGGQSTEGECEHRWFEEHWVSSSERGEERIQIHRVCLTCGCEEQELIGDCIEHQWAEIKTYKDAEVIEQHGCCSVCNRYVLISTSENTCEHDWYYKTEHYEETYCAEGDEHETVYECVVEGRWCTKCQVYEVLSRTCDGHVFEHIQYWDSIVDEITTEYDICIKCYYQTNLYVAEEIHEWIEYKKYNGETCFYWEATCTKCGLIKVLCDDYDNFAGDCQHDWDECYEYGEDGELLYADRCCILCGLWEQTYPEP